MDTENNFKKYLNDLIGEDEDESNDDINDCSIKENLIWNKQRKEYNIEQRRQKNVVLAELNEINVKSLNDFIPNSFFQENYAKEYHVQNILNTYCNTNNSKGILTQEINPNLILEKEKYETSKRFLNDYMLYLLSKEFPIILNNFNNVNCFYQIVSSIHNNITSIQFKMNTIKSKLINIIAITYLKKQKIQNCKKVLSHLNVINKWKSNYFLSINPLQIKELSFGEVITFLKEINISKFSEKSKIAYLLIEDIDKQKHKHKSHFEEELMTIFITLKKELDIKNIYEKYIIMTNNKNESLFMKEVFMCFEKTLFKIVKSSILCNGTLNVNSNVNTNMINKLEMLKDVEFEDEDKLFLCYQQICLNVLKMLSIYNEYSLYQNVLPFKKELTSNKHLVVQMISSKIVELIDLYIKKISICVIRKYTYLIIACLCILNKGLNMFCKLNKEENTLQYKISFLIKFVIFDELKEKIQKTKVLLSNDTWKRIPNFTYNDILKIHSSYIEQSQNYIQLLYNNNEISLNCLYEMVFNIHNEKSKYNSHNKITILQNKQIQSNKIIFSSSVVNVLNFIIDFIKYDSVFSNITNELYSYICVLFEYFVTGGIYMFIPLTQIQFILNKNISLNNIFTYDQIETIHTDVIYIQRYLNLKFFILDTHSKIINKIFNKEFSLSSILPTLSSDILHNVTNVYSCLIEKINFYETTFTLLKFIKHSIPSSKQSFLKGTITKLQHYKTVLNELKEFLYYYSCQNVFNIKPMIFAIETKDWNLYETEGGSRFNDANDYVYNIVEEMNEKYQYLELLSSDTLTEKAKQRYLMVGIWYLINELFKVISRIERFSSVGRGIILRDVMFLCNYFKEVMNVNGDSFFKELILYIKAWYYDEKEMVDYVNKSNVEFKYVSRLIDRGGVVGKEDVNKRMRLKKVIADLVIQKIQLFLKTFK